MKNEVNHHILNSFSSTISKILGPNRSWNEEALSDIEIEQILLALSKCDTNNFSNIIQAGEREARIYSDIVSRRHFNLGHGIGRSGNLTESQPKAQGSSILQLVSNELCLQALRCTLKHVASCFISPVATGMSLLLCIQSIRLTSKPNGKYIIWPRCDQKSALKAIVASANLQPVIVENQLDMVSMETKTDLPALENAILEHRSNTEHPDPTKHDAIVCVLSTTSAFSPRGVDDLYAIGKLCNKYNVPHVVNNAYGLQSTVCCERIEQAALKSDSRVDFVVQSCDKNFMVPVSGAIIAGYDAEKIEQVKRVYAGRASMSANLDMFITLLSMGRNGYLKLLKDQKEIFDYLKTLMMDLAERFNERILDTKSNKISLAMTLNNIRENQNHEKLEITMLGSMIFNSNITGCRVIDGKKVQKIGDKIEIKSFGSHINNYPYAYLNVACSIGMTKAEADNLVKKLEKIIGKFIKK